MASFKNGFAPKSFSDKFQIKMPFLIIKPKYHIK